MEYYICTLVSSSFDLVQSILHDKDSSTLFKFIAESRNGKFQIFEKTFLGFSFRLFVFLHR